MTSRAVIDHAALAINGGTPVSADRIGIIAVKLEQEDIDAALGVLTSGMLAQGKNVAEFEQHFATASGSTHAAACANGTCALQLAYEPLIEPGDDVLVPAWTYIATASMLAARGANPIWVDVDPETYCIDPGDAAAKVTDKTTAIACTHLYGNPVDIDAIESLAADRGLSVIYDAAQAHLATYKGRGIGAFGDAVTYSFYPTKNMTTGEGGMVTTNDEELDARIRSLRSHGESEKYVHDSIGYNYRMTDMAGAIGRHQLDRLPNATARRRANAARLDAALADVDGLTAPGVTSDAESAYHLYPVRITPEAFVEPPAGTTVRQMLCDALLAEGVGTAVHYPRSLTRQPVFDRPGVEHQPVSDRLAETLFCVPVHQMLTEAQVTRVGEALAKVAAAYRA
jgi:perosamine synthetase